MGTGGSFLRSQDDDDILGSDLDGNGVLKRIPIEMKPRGKLGLRSVGSLNKKSRQGGSLRSALSVDLENAEVEKIRKDFEMYRLNKENDIANMQRKEQKLETDLKRLRAELTVLQKTCNNLRQERDAAFDEKQQALARAAAFEHDRDKVQRVFKIFRETKENEIQNLLRAKRELENKVSKIAHGYLPEDTDTASRSGLDSSLGNSNPGDWWPALESEPSMGSTVQLHQTTFRGPEFASSMMEFEGPFTNVNKEDWSTALENLNQLEQPIPDEAISATLRLYISAPKDAQAEVDVFLKDYRPRLHALCEGEGRSLTVMHLYYDDMENMSTVILEHQHKLRKHQAEKSFMFLAFLGDFTNRFTSSEFQAGHLDNPGSKSAVFCFREARGNHSSSEARELRNKVRDTGRGKIIDGYITPSQGAEQAFQELEKIISVELGIDTKKKADDFTVREGDVSELSGCGVWDVNCHAEQLEAFSNAVKSSCELAFEKHYERLNAHVLSAGPLPPLLVLSPAGTGRSLLLCKWIQLQIEKCPGSLVLHHFVESRSSISADPVVMIRRITAQLMQQVTSPPALTCDPVRLVEEFPRWLEKVSSKSPGGVILVIDSIDRFQQAEVHLKWLLDPLPVDARVIVSAHDEMCPQAWRYCILEGNGMTVMDSTAIQFCARNISAVAGDMRKALDVCRRAVEMVEKDVKSQSVLKSTDSVCNSPVKQSPAVPKKISVLHINNVLSDVYGSGASSKQQETVPLQQKLVVCSLLVLLKHGKMKEVTLGKLHEVYAKVCRNRQIASVDQSEFQGITTLLEARGILGIKKAKETRLAKVTLKIDEKELEHTMQDKVLISSILEQGLPK